MRYRTVTCEGIPAAVRVAHFSGPSGVDEYHLMVQPTAGADIATQAAWVRRAYRQACAALGLGDDTGVFLRCFCSDLPHQAATLAAQLGELEASHAVSWISQPPASPAQLALWAYHVQLPGAALEKTKAGATLTVQRVALAHCWTAGLTCTEAETPYAQTAGIFAEYEEILRARGLNVADHLQRTWFFVQDVDVNYQGLVTARREFFTARGLTPDTHYIASTGIEGAAANVVATVMLDAYAIAGVRPAQIRFLAAPEHLCPTHLYGVTFERGVSVAYQDRKHIFISGTASIDHTGSILHPGDVRRQLDRTMENVAALLAQAGATFADVGMFIVYVRNPGDLEIIRQLMLERHGDTPMQVVVAHVCRPGWLVEVECAAVVSIDEPGLPAF